MADQNPKGPGTAEPITIADRDHRAHAEALRKVLSIYPETITLDELTRELTVASREFAEHDRVQHAVRELVAGGLLHLCADDLVLPTRAAVNYSRLLEED